MGKPVRIADFAENFIRLSGYIPHQEIQIRYTGLRPGEKLFEELFDKTEKCLPTFHSKLMMAVPEVPALSFLSQNISELEHAVLKYGEDEVMSIIQKMVPNFKNGQRSAAQQRYSHIKENRPPVRPIQELY